MCKIIARTCQTDESHFGRPVRHGARDGGDAPEQLNFAQFTTQASVVRHWQEQTAAYENYVKLDALRALFESKDAVLVKASYLLKCAEEGVVLPRRQDLPDARVVGDDELARLFGEIETVLSMGVNGQTNALFTGIVAISYSWEKKGIPTLRARRLPRCSRRRSSGTERASTLHPEARRVLLVAGPENCAILVQGPAAHRRERRLWRIP